MSLVEPSAVVLAVKEAGIVPDVIPDETSFTPEALVVVKWPTGKEATLGNTLTKIDTANEPLVSITPVQSSTAATDVGYTVVLTDPDATSRSNPTLREWRHWVATGLKPSASTGADTADLVVTRPPTTPYYPPAPPRGTGLHRYVFLLYQEPTVDFIVPDPAPEFENELKDRGKWNAARFADKHGLRLVGVNFFYVKGDE